MPLENISNNSETKIQQGNGTSKDHFWCFGQEMLLSGSDNWAELWMMGRNLAKFWKIPAIPSEWTVMQISKSRLELDVFEGFVGLRYTELGMVVERHVWV